MTVMARTAYESDDVVREFARTWAETISGPAYDLAANMTCDEVESLASLLISCGEPEAGMAWIDLHSLSDECDDMHCRCGGETCAHADVELVA